MKIIIAADIFNNKIHVNNLYGYIINNGKIIIKYFDKIIYENEITLLKDNSILWYSPYLKMTNISKINVSILDEKNNEICSETPITYVTFMRSDNSELNNLCDYIKHSGNIINNIVEIGSFQGESTTIFRNNFPNAKIYAVDPWIINYDEREISINAFNALDIENNFNILTKNFNIIKIKMFSSEFANIIADNIIDFIYIDGDHSYNGVNNDIISWKNKIKTGGFIGGHDYNDIQSDTVVKAVKEHFSNINTFGPSWLIKK